MTLSDNVTRPRPGIDERKSAVADVVDARRSVRAYTDRPVDRAVIERVLEQATRSPSGGNLQPWHIYAVSGPQLERLRDVMRTRLESEPLPDPTEYAVYPEGLTRPYSDRRRQIGRQLYESIGIDRQDKMARKTQSERNFDFFGAPVGLYCYVDRQMGAAQWCDLGMYLQTVMLLLKAEGIDSCPQEAWSLYHQTVTDFLGAPEDLMLFCGMAIGYGDDSHPANNFRAGRAPLSEVCEFHWD